MRCIVGVTVHADQKNRFHAWQSSILFSILFVLHLILSWSTFLSWVLLLVDLGTIGYLTMRAYRDGMLWILLYSSGADVIQSGYT